LRVGALVIIVGAVFALTHVRRQNLERLERQRALLLERVSKAASGVTARDRELVARVRPWVERAVESYAGDWIADELDAAGALAAVLARPSVYLRGPLSGLSGPGALTRAAIQSFNDALVLCLVDPPAARTEKLLLARARSTFAGGERMHAVAHVERLLGALLGLPLLAPEFRERVIEAGDSLALDRLEREFERAPIASAKRAARAEVLLYAVDEPGSGTGPTELDGERPHDVRVGVVDLVAGRPLLRVRRRVDPSWLSAPVRAEFASAIDSCALALDVHSAVTLARSASRPELP
jgi:hypothetical protein